MRFIRRIYNANKKHGRYPCVSIPQELAGVVGKGDFVYMEPRDGGILIKPVRIEQDE